MEHRLAAVLAAEMGSYSRLEGTDDSHALQRTSPWSRQVVAGIVLLVLTLGGQAGSLPTRDDPVLAAVCAVAMERLVSYGAPEPECNSH